MRFISSILFGLFVITSAAQPTFMLVFRATGTAQGNLNELNSGNLRIGVARQSGTSLIRPNGSIIQSHNYEVDTFLVIQSVERYTDNDFYFAGGYYLDSCSSSGGITQPFLHPVVGRMDSMGTILSVRHYRLNTAECGNMAGDLEVLSDGGAVAWGVKETRFFALRTEPNGDVQWGKRFNGNGIFRFMKELPGGDLLAGFDMDSVGACVARFAPDGNVLWCKSYLRPTGVIHDALLTADGSLIITGLTNELADKLFIMKLSVNGDVLWCRGYSSPTNSWYTGRRTQIVASLDGNYAMLATLGQDEFLDFFRPLLMKINGNGDTLWTRSYGANDYLYETVSLLAYSDSGYLFYGRVWGELPEGQMNFAFLYKADSLGHLPCDEHQYVLEVADLFPTDSSFTLTSTDGATAFPAFIADQTYPPITQYDGCTLQPTRVPTISKRPPNMSVRPNPNTGRFTMAFKDPLVADSWYSVYDATGKLLYQRRLNPGQGTEEVDLSRYGKGTYLIKCTDKEGVYHERVVVE